MNPKRTNPPKIALFPKKVNPPNSSESPKGLTLQVIFFSKRINPRLILFPKWINLRISSR